MYTIDTSVFVNGYDTNEPGHADSRTFLQAVRTRNLLLVLPELLLAEEAGALARTRGDLVAVQTLCIR